MVTQEILLDRRSLKRGYVQLDDDYLRAQINQNDPWGWDGLYSGDDYEKEYLSLDDQFSGSLEQWAERRKAQGKSTRVADFYGGGYIFDNFDHVDAMIGVRLFNQDSELLRAYRDEPEYVARLQNIMACEKRHVVEGNLADPLTWSKFQNTLAMTGGNSIDLAFFRPIGGIKPYWSTMDRVIPLWQNVKRAYRYLSHDDGKLFITMPSGTFPFADKALAVLEKVPGLSVNKDEENHTAQLIKHSNAPRVFAPGITDLIYAAINGSSAD